MHGVAANPAVTDPGRIAADHPRPGRPSPGQEFAWALRTGNGAADLTVPLRTHLPAAFPLFTTRPRYTVRHLMKIATVPDRATAYVHEPPASQLRPAGTSYDTTPESAFAPRLREAPLTDLTVTVPLPAGLLAEPDLLGTFIDYRVLVRLSAVENEALLHGTADQAIPGLLSLPEARTGRLGDDRAESILAAAAEVEETGGSCDGIVVHPFTYWALVRDGVLEHLAKAGITVSRTRMISRDQVLLGDFKAAVTLLLPDVSSLGLRRGAGPDGADVVDATTRVGLAVHLPQHFLLLSRD